MNAPVRPKDFAVTWPTHADGQPATLVAALARNAAEYPGRVAFRERKYGVWQEQTWSEVLEEVAAIALGLQARGLSAGAALTIIGDNRPRLYYAMLAANMLKAFPSPAYPDIPLDELVAATRHGAPTVAVGEDQEQVDKLLELRAKIGRPNTIVYDDRRGLDGYADPGIVSFDQVIAEGRERLARDPALMASLIGQAGADDVTVLLHSSGTTGLPKGIPLRHSNVTRGVLNAGESGYFQKHEELFAYLPTAWVGDFVFTLGAGLMLVATINIPERQETVLHDLREVVADLLSRRAARLGPDADPHPGRHEELDAAEAPAVRPVHAAGGGAGEEAARRRHADPRRAGGRRHRQCRRLCPLARLSRPDAGRARLHRRRGAGRGHVPVLPGARHPPQAVLRPDRDLRAHRRAERGPRQAPYRRPSDGGGGTEDRRQRRDPGALAFGHFRLLSTTPRARPRRSSTAGCTPAMPG
ncbi:MAG: AMP-binding protein [Piscinibacter sp.]